MNSCDICLIAEWCLSQPDEVQLTDFPSGRFVKAACLHCTATCYYRWLGFLEGLEARGVRR